MYFRNFVIISPREFEQTWILFSEDCFVSFGLVVLVKKTKMWKVYDDNDDDNGSGELKMIY